MDISQVAKQTGVPTSTLRYYEKVGLITSLGRTGARRVFASAVLQQLALISLGQAAGLSLGEIRAMLTPNGKLQIDRELLAKKAAEIDLLSKQLRAMSRGLRHAAACSAVSHTECPTFKRLVATAAAGTLQRAPAALEPSRSKKKAVRRTR